MPREAGGPHPPGGLVPALHASFAPDPGRVGYNQGAATGPIAVRRGRSDRVVAMTVTIYCIYCGKALVTSPAMAGRRVRCGGCRHEFVLPEAAALAPSGTQPAAPGEPHP